MNKLVLLFTIRREEYSAESFHVSHDDYKMTEETDNKCRLQGQGYYGPYLQKENTKRNVRCKKSKRMMSLLDREAAGIIYALVEQ